MPQHLEAEANMTTLLEQDPEIKRIIDAEAERQKRKIVLIASENYASRAVMEAQGSILTNKYAEGYPGKRYYGGCEFVDQAETLAIERAKELFGAEHVNVQPHAGAQANMGVYFSLLEPGDTVMGLRLDQGGHLTHGSPVNFSGRYYNFVSYGLDPDTELIDYDEVDRLAREHRPKLIVTGATAYPRIIDFARFRQIADEVGALLMVDMAHIAGLVAAGVHPSCVPHAQVVTTTTHKTLRGPRGAMIMCNKDLASSIDKGVFPRMQGGPFMHAIAAKAVAFGEALRPEFKLYQQSVVDNARILANQLQELGFRIVSGGNGHSPDAGGRVGAGAHWERGRRSVRRREHHGQQERDTQRPKAAPDHERVAGRDSGGDQQRFRARRNGGNRAADVPGGYEHRRREGQGRGHGRRWTVDVSVPSARD